jgi:hypothetical protein
MHTWFAEAEISVESAWKDAYRSKGGFIVEVLKRMRERS